MHDADLHVYILRVVNADWFVSNIFLGVPFACTTCDIAKAVATAIHREFVMAGLRWTRCLPPNTVTVSLPLVCG